MENEYAFVPNLVFCTFFEIIREKEKIIKKRLERKEKFH